MATAARNKGLYSSPPAVVARAQALAVTKPEAGSAKTEASQQRSAELHPSHEVYRCSSFPAQSTQNSVHGIAFKRSMLMSLPHSLQRP